MEITVANILDGTRGELVQGSVDMLLHGVSTDSRTAGCGELFLAIRGEKFDGHDYVGKALAKGAAALVVSRWPLDVPGHVPVVLVPDTTRAYSALAAWWRDRMPARVVGITGSNGKTTAKDMTAHLLGRVGPTIRSEGNHNNHMGVPETLLRIRPEHAFAVVEMGTNHPGELACLACTVRPDVALITNIGPSHLEAFRSVRGVAREKGRILDFLRPGGLAVLNADDPWSLRLAACHKGRKVTFGLGPHAHWRASAIWPSGARLRFVLDGWGQAFSVPVVGRCQASNCLAAIAVAWELGLSVPEAAWTLESFEPPPMRMALRQAGDLTLILDCYNANPASMSAAIEELASWPVKGRRVAVLGDMLELGRVSEGAHRSLGRFVAAAAVDLLCAVGERSVDVAGAAIRAGMPEANVFWRPDKAPAVGWLLERLAPGDTVLFKASRGVQLEEVASQVEAWASAQGARAQSGAAAGPSRRAALAAASGAAPLPGRGDGETRRGSWTA